MKNQEVVEKNISYRKEIDGLRGIAVIAVIINHLNKNWLPGGFLGVDIFFVISGFVITSSLSIKTYKNFNEFIISFYKRRIRRILPALFVVILINSFLITLINPTPDSSLKTSLSAIFGLSNIYLFFTSTDYFSQSTLLNPFTHTWSLGVEEQFYFIFPILFWIAGIRLNKIRGENNLFLIVSFLSTISFIFYIFYSFQNPSAAYFLMPARFWEIGLGCLTYILTKKDINFIRVNPSMQSLILFILILATFFLSPEAIPISTTLIVLLISYLILVIHSRSFIYKLLTNKLILKIGILSYSLYLWHWPLISLTRWTFGINGWSIITNLLILILVSFLSFKFIEDPIRRRKDTKKIFVFGIFSAIVLSLYNFILRSNNSLIYSGDKSYIEENKIYKKLKLESISPNSKRVIAIGDSHTGHLAGLMYSIHNEYGYSIRMHARGEGIDKFPTKSSFIKPVVDYYKKSLNKNDIIILANLYGPNLSKKLIEEYEYLISLARLRNSNVIIIGPIPFFNDFPDNITCIKEWFRSSSNISNSCYQVENKAYFEKYFKNSIKNLKEIERKENNVFYFDALSSICFDSNKCRTIFREESIYRDDDHLTFSGSKLLKEKLDEILNKINLNNN